LYKIYELLIQETLLGHKILRRYKQQDQSHCELSHRTALSLCLSTDFPAPSRVSAVDKYIHTLAVFTHDYVLCQISFI